VVVPAGAISPGPATARIVSPVLGRLDHRVRFAMPTERSARVRLLFTPRVHSTEALVVEVRSERGDAVRLRVPREPHPPSATGIFVGDAVALGAAQEPLRGVRDPRGVALADSLRLVSPTAVEALGCRALGRAQLVIAHEPGEHLEALRACVARGASVIVVADQAPAPGLASGGSRVWGAGVLGWARDLDQDLAAVAIATTSMEQASGLAQRLAGLAQNRTHWSASPPRRGVPRAALFALLAGYVLLLGPVGWLVLRRRRTVQSWLYFPAVAVLATLAIGVVTLGSDGAADTLRVFRTKLLAPDGTGLELVGLRLDGVHAREYAIDAPWMDADLGAVIRPHRFGSPFARAAGDTIVVEDRVRGRVRASELAVARASQAAISWIQPTAALPPRLEGGPSGPIVTAPADAGVRELLVLRGDKAARLLDLRPGERRAVTLRDRMAVVSDAGGASALAGSLDAWLFADQSATLALAVMAPRRTRVRIRPAVPVVDDELRIAVEELR
jgi:hypothetical protein